MPLAFPFDYSLSGSTGTTGRRVRLYHTRNSAFFQSDRRAFAIAVWTLSRNPLATVSDILADQKSLTIDILEEVDYDSPADLDSTDVCSLVGESRLLALANELDNTPLACWLRQEADLIEKNEK